MWTKAGEKPGVVVERRRGALFPSNTNGKTLQNFNIKAEVKGKKKKSEKIDLCHVAG